MEPIYTINQKELKDNLQKMENASDVMSVLFLMTNDDTFPVEFLNPLLNSLKKPVIGGVFYELIYKSELKKNGILLIPLSFEIKTEIFDYTKTDKSIFETLEDTYSNNLSEKGSVFIFTDAFTTSKSLFIEDLFNFFGFKFSFIGAGCGSDSYESFPCIIHSSGIHSNAGVIGYSTEPVAFGVAHGWKSISQPLKVSESDLNVVKTINWEPAFEMYKNIVEKHSGLTFNDDNFLDIAKSYPVGLNKIDDEMVIRDPFMTKDGALYCLDNIDKGQYISIMNGDAKSLIEGAAIASHVCNASSEKKGITTESLFCIDCISRVKFLSDDYSKELQAIGGKELVNGVVSFGEIANVGDSFLEIYNKTVIVAKW